MEAFLFSLCAANALIVIPPQNTTVLEGSRVRLDCLAAANPDNITHRWYHNGYEVIVAGSGEPGVPRASPVTSLLVAAGSLSSRATIELNGSLVVSGVSRDDAGWYRCRPNNDVGVPPEAQAFLNVTCEFWFSMLCHRTY
jgi:hypothetical protein